MREVCSVLSSIACFVLEAAGVAGAVEGAEVADAVAADGPARVEVTQNEAGAWQILKDGEPYYVRGAGGDASKRQLAEAGGNTFRTWGVGPETGALLDEAHELGLMVIVGHWLGHPRHGFDYNDLDSVAGQFVRVREDVLKHKDHPALLMWGIGNEMEGFEQGDNAAIWSHVQSLAAMVKNLDPMHPTLTTTAELGGRRVEAVHKLCPDLDVLGINSYGGAPSALRRYRDLGGTKPVLFTEFGPPGTWEVGRTSFGAPPELTSTQKAAIYRDVYTRGCQAHADLCLGGFAFAWGYKMEATATWFGMFLPNGDKLAAVDAMTEVWSGQPPANRCPEIREFGVVGEDVVTPGDTVRVNLDVVDPEGREVTTNWTFRGEASTYLTGGDVQGTPLALDGVIVESGATGATLVMPGGGIYRLYLTISDGEGGGATANVPLQVDGPPAPARTLMPVAVYADGQPEPWASSGWMGAHEDLSLDLRHRENPHSGDHCLEVSYANPGRWVGVAWQHPVDDWGEKPGGFDLTGAEKLTFWARGEKGGEKVTFGYGLLDGTQEYKDTSKGEKKDVKLKREWKRYSIQVKGADLSRIKTGFFLTASGHGRAIRFYLDDIRFE